MFDGGILKCHVENIKMNQGLGEEYEIPVPVVPDRTPGGLVLIDGGNAAECATDPEGTGAQISTVYWPVMTPEQACVPALKAAGFDPADVRYVLQSHLHLDHTGRAGRDRPVPQRGGRRQARRVRVRVRAGLVRRRRLHPEGLQQARRPWSLLEDNEDGYDLFGDGVIRCWSTPGHAPGHQSFEVTLPNSGTMLLTIDAAYTTDHWNEKALPGLPRLGRRHCSLGAQAAPDCGAIRCDRGHRSRPRGLADVQAQSGGLRLTLRITGP